MQLRLKKPSERPPGGWRYFQAETRLWFNGDDQGVRDMAERIARHRGFKGLPRASANEAMEDIHTQLCERLGPEWCRTSDGRPFFHIKKDLSQNIDSTVAIAATKAFVEFLKSGAELEIKEEALRRGEICRSCHLNTEGKGCVSCGGLNKLVAAALPTDRHQAGLHICAACGCGLKAKVNVTENVIRAADSGSGRAYPPWCWIPPILAKEP